MDMFKKIVAFGLLTAGLIVVQTGRGINLWREPQLSREQKELNCKEELLKEANAIVAYRDEFFECFAYPYGPDRENFEKRYKACNKLNKTLVRAGLIKKIFSENLNHIVRERLYLEMNLVGYHFSWRFSPDIRDHNMLYNDLRPDIKEKWNRTMNDLEIERKKTFFPYL